jgi:hypothetical protein
MGEEETVRTGVSSSRIIYLSVVRRRTKKKKIGLFTYYKIIIEIVINDYDVRGGESL